MPAERHEDKRNTDESLAEATPAELLEVEAVVDAEGAAADWLPAADVDVEADTESAVTELLTARVDVIADTEAVVELLAATVEALAETEGAAADVELAELAVLDEWLAPFNDCGMGTSPGGAN
jgi:hypothetical protein